MTDIHAALVDGPGRPPRVHTVPAPVAEPGQEIVDVLAVGVHHVTRAIAAGVHYASRDRFPLLPGVDGIARRADGTLAAVFAPTTGTMSERLAVDASALIPLPDGDPVLLAAALNPVISSWMVLSTRVPVAGRSVLVLGATGSAGSAAVHVARRLGASRVVAAGRNPVRMEQLRPFVDAVVVLDDDRARVTAELAAEAADVDIVLDYLWGPVTEMALGTVLRARADETQLLDWVQIGSLAGQDITLPAAALRSNALRLSGSGFGSVPFRAYLQETPKAAAAIAEVPMGVHPRPVPLADIEAAWATADPAGERTVITF